jgi:phenylalanyl-tRNA synthetase alpha chain
MHAIEELERRAAREIGAAPDTRGLKELEAKYLGKSGELTGLLKSLGSLPPDQKPAFGKALNEAKERLAQQLEQRERDLKAGERAEQFDRERIDITMPGRRPPVGREHILQLTMNKIKQVFAGLGFEYVETPELEKFKYNFDVLNYPPDHPAMDEQDTFYIENDLLLRTQATAYMGHVFETRKPPFRIFTIGRCFRNEAVDRTHSHTFHQIDAFMVDEGVSMAHLKGTLGAFARAMFGSDATVRFRPDFFPFVEPGVDYAISTKKLFDGKWVELGGAGLVHPNILEAYGIDTDRYSGWAFGLGVDRIPMMQYGVEDLRHFLENDLRFLEQFR